VWVALNSNTYSQRVDEAADTSMGAVVDAEYGLWDLRFKTSDSGTGCISTVKVKNRDHSKA
jgi:hypothetical protein